MGSKNVLVMLTSSFPDRSGDASFIQHEIAQLADAFDRVFIFSFARPKGTLFSLPPNVEYVGPLKSLRRTEAFSALLDPRALGRAWRALRMEAKWCAELPYLKLTVGNIFTGLRFSEAIAKALLARGVTQDDSVVVYSFWASHAAMALPFLDPRYKKFFRLHRFDLYEFGDSHLPLRASLFAAAARLLPISDHGKSYLLAKYPSLLDEQNVEVMRLGTADHGSGPMGARSKDAPIEVVSCSSVVPVKRVADILPALELLSKRRPVHWTHFGDGPLMGELKIRTAEAVTDALRIDLKGQVSNEQMIDHYKNQAVDAFVNVSDSEGVPVSIMEALSFGIPVVATDAGGTGELVSWENRTGVLLPLRPSADLLAEAIDEVARRPEVFEPREVWKRLSDAEANGEQLARLLAGTN